MKTTLAVDGKHLSVIVRPPTQPGKGVALSLHGGGLSSKESTDYLADCFTDRGFGWVSFDCTGWGESSGERAKCSLADRLDEALAVIQHYGLTLDFLIGSSMGGYVAVKLLERVSAHKLILFCPAAYAVSAWQLPFGDGFTEAIRRQDSFLESDVGEICARYPGDVLYVTGENDEIIPAAVDRIYSTAFRTARSFRKVRLDGCPHPIHRWSADKPDVMATIRQALSRHIEESA